MTYHPSMNYRDYLSANCLPDSLSNWRKYLMYSCKAMQVMTGPERDSFAKRTYPYRHN